MDFKATSKVLLGAALFVAVVSSAPANAAVDVDFGANVRIDDDTDLYFAVSSRYFDRDRHEVERWSRRYADPDDLAVALFISTHSGASLKSIFSLRRDGHTWWQIGIRFGVPQDVWFVPVEREPGPPYGHAYGHWKKHKQDPRAAYVLADPDVRNLVAVRLMHEYYGVSVEAAMDRRSEGRNLQALVSEQYRGRHGNGAAKGSDKPSSKHDGHPGKGHGKKD